MHELSLCRDLLRLVEKAVAKQSYETILMVNVEIGPFSNIEVSALEFAFTAAKENTLAASAQISIRTSDAIGVCPNCCTEHIMHERFEACPMCDYFPINLKTGSDMVLKSVEVK